MTTYLKKYLTNTTEDKQSTAAIAFLAGLDHIKTATPLVCENIVNELNDQRSHLKLIASENYSSLAVQLAMGNLLTDKYAEGYAHHRFYAGCENIDQIEEMAQNELCNLFGCDYASVQPHSGADANIIAFWSILCQRVQNKEVERLNKKTIDELSPQEYEEVRKLLNSQRIMGMSLNSGGHLTHGYRHNISSKMMQSFVYDVDEKTGELNYQTLLRQAKEVRPLILLAGYSAYPRLINFAKMREIADEVGAVLMVDMAHFSGLVAGKVMTGENNPIPYADIVTSTTHKTLRGPRGGIILCTKEFSDIVNKGCPLVMGGPLPHVMAAKAVAFKEANTQEFSDYAHRIVKNSKTLANTLIENGIDLLTGGTDNHLMIMNLSSLGITGRQGEQALLEAMLTVNRNAIPNDVNGAWYTSGLRIGTPALTTLGMGETEMKVIGKIIANILKNTKAATVETTGKASKAKYTLDQDVLNKAKGMVAELLESFPLYPEITL
ncbi:MAG: glycine hydroxymethyltransferase [Chlamydiota bacterium]|nr:glycine hydroxymethyltransferase [Chlamydiota bacterium]